MDLVLIRERVALLSAPCQAWTQGKLYVDGLAICDTLEPSDMGFTSDTSPGIIFAAKEQGLIAVPRGRYEILMSVPSPSWSKSPWAWGLTRGRMPRLSMVPCFVGVLIHPGNTVADTRGCILVGQASGQPGRLVSSRATFTYLWRLMEAAHIRGDEIWITIKY